MSQEKLVEQLKITDKPCLIIGSYGMGKHKVVQQACSLPILDVSEKLSKELIEDFYTDSTPQLILIDMPVLAQHRKISLIQNSLLKFIEEPPEHKKIIILAESKNQVVEPILNRCQVLTMLPYSFDELNAMSGNQLETVKHLVVQEVLTTPLEATQLSLSTIKEIEDLIQLILAKINIATVPNTLSIATRINFGNEIDKYDLNFFIKVLLYYLREAYLNQDNLIYLEAYKCVKQTQKDLLKLNINKKYLVESTLLHLKRIFTC